MPTIRDEAPRKRTVAIKRAVEAVWNDLLELDEGIAPFVLTTLQVTVQRLTPRTIYGSVSEAVIDMLDVADRLERDGYPRYADKLDCVVILAREVLEDLEN